MVVGVSDHATAGRHNVVDVKAVDDHILGELNAKTSTIGNVNIGTTSIDGLVTRHHQLLGQLDDHATPKYDPQWTFLNCSISEGSGFRVHDVVVRCIGNDVDLAPLATGGLSAKTKHALGKPLTFVGPFWVATPAAVDRVCGQARASVFLQAPPGAIASLQSSACQNVDVSILYNF